jgi:hypothetical protein
MSVLDSQLVDCLARVLIAAVFILAGAVKLANPINLRRDINAYKLIPQSFATVTGYLLPPIEIILGLFLLLGILTSTSALSIAVLSLVFFLASISAIVRRLNIECGCFGLLYREKIGAPALLRELLLFGLAIFIWQFEADRIGIDSLATANFDVSFIATLVILVLVASLSAATTLWRQPST